MTDQSVAAKRFRPFKSPDWSISAENQSHSKQRLTCFDWSYLSYRFPHSKFRSHVKIIMNNNNNDSFYSTSNNDFFNNFDSFVDPSMLLLSEDVNFASDLAVMDSIPALPSEIPPVTTTRNGQSSSGEKPGSLYEKLTTTPTLSPGSPYLPASPSLYPFTSPYAMESPSSLMMSSTNINSDPSWMISNRPRRRRSTYSSPSLMPSNLHQHNQYMMSTPNQMALGFNAMNMPFGSPMMMSSPYHQGFMMGAPPMSPMNLVVKLPMAPLTPTSMSNSNSSVKIPLVLPCHLQQQQQQQIQNTVAPNVSKLQTNIATVESEVSSFVPSRCSSIAPNSSISSRSNNSTQNWFNEMSITKDRFLEDVASLDFTNVTVLELKQVLRKFGLNSTGKKVQLVERIKEISIYLKAEGRKRVKVEEKKSTGTEELEPVLSSNESVISSRNNNRKISTVV
jgi:hypothetical protein